MKQNCLSQSPIPESRKKERVTLIVVVITLVTMTAEIIAGIISGSMALLSDGIHMGTHAVALFITLAAYIFARKHSGNPSFSFGTGKVGVLGGYTNAILLMLAAGAMIVESIERLVHPVNILFNEAIIVAVTGLIVNIISAVILGHGNGHTHDHGHSHRHTDHADHSCGHSHHQSTGKSDDHNLKAAYLHVLTDALTSVLAIAALLIAKFYGLVWADPAVGILGAIVVARWAVGLLRQTSSLLLDKSETAGEIDKIRDLIESDGAMIKDIHIWPLSESSRSLILSIESPFQKTPSYFHKLVAQTGHYEHITVEVNHTGGQGK